MTDFNAVSEDELFKAALRGDMGEHQRLMAVLAKKILRGMFSPSAAAQEVEAAEE